MKQKRASTFLLLLLAASLNFHQAKAQTDRPNILLICTDQQFADAMSATGNPYLSTPAMDSIAGEGVTFAKAYCSQASCVPSRASFMTGLMPDRNGVNYNGTPPLQDECAARYLKEAGYRTGYVGKWHLPRSIEDVAWSGFDYRAEIRNNSVDYDIPAACQTFLEGAGDEPFFLVASFVNPHDICEYARILSGINDELNNGEIGEPPSPELLPPLPDNYAIPHNEPAAIRVAQSLGNVGTYPTRSWIGSSGELKWQKYLWGYYRMIELVDGYIGELLDDIDQLGFGENTVIIFTSDHGDGMGAHRWNQKYIHYDESSRIPLVISWKGRTPGGTVNSTRLVNLGLDLFPTIFDFAGIAKPSYMLGASAMPQSLGEATGEEHDFIVSEIELQQEYNRRSPYLARMVRSQRYKYVRYNQLNHPEQLFDMDADPGETTSLVYDPNHKAVLNEHRRMLDRWIHDTKDSFEPFAGNDQEATDPLGGAEFAGGWNSSWRFGEYYAGHWPYLYHLRDGWQYVMEEGSGADSLLLYDLDSRAWKRISGSWPYYYFNYTSQSWGNIGF